MTNTDDVLARVCQALEDDDHLYDDLYEHLYDDEDEVELAPLPVEPAKRGSLRQAIERGLQERGCDHTLRKAEAWACHEKVPWAWLQDELEERDGYLSNSELLNDAGTRPLTSVHGLHHAPLRGVSIAATSPITITTAPLIPKYAYSLSVVDAASTSAPVPAVVPNIAQTPLSPRARTPPCALSRTRMTD